MFGKHLLPSNTVSQIESKLEDLENDVQQYEQQVKCVELLQQKQAWLDYHAQNEHNKSLISAIELLKKQKEETMARFESIEEKVASVKGDDTKKCFEKQIKNIEDDIRSAQVKREKLLKDAEKGAPLKEWNERLVKDDDVKAKAKLVASALSGAKSNLDSKKATRTGSKRKMELADLGSQIRQFFFQDYKSENEMRNARKVKALRKARGRMRKASPLLSAATRRRAAKMGYDPTDMPAKGNWQL